MAASSENGESGGYGSESWQANGAWRNGGRQLSKRRNGVANRLM